MCCAIAAELARTRVSVAMNSREILELQFMRGGGVYPHVLPECIPLGNSPISLSSVSQKQSIIAQREMSACRQAMTEKNGPAW